MGSVNIAATCFSKLLPCSGSDGIFFVRFVKVNFFLSQVVSCIMALSIVVKLMLATSRVFSSFVIVCLEV